MDAVKKEVNSWMDERNKNTYVINWQLTAADARIKLKRLGRVDSHHQLTFLSRNANQATHALEKMMT